MSDHEQEIARLRLEASRLPNGSTKMSMMEQAVALADAQNDLDLAYRLREELLSVANFAGRGDVVLVHFSWCLAQYDRHPGRFPAHTLHWTYKWVVSGAPTFPEISRAQIDELLRDLGERYERVGGSLFTLWQLRRDVMVEMGDAEEARVAHRRLRRLRRGYLSDCPACVASNHADYYFFINRRAQAFRALKPLLENQLTCAEQPIFAVSRALPYLFAAKRVEEAREFQRKYSRELRHHSSVTAWVAHHIEFLTLDANFAAATRLLDRYLPAALADTNLLRRFVFLRAAGRLLARLAEQGKRGIRTRLPESVTLSVGADAGPAPLSEWFTQQAQQIAARFDARNGNSWYSRRL